MIVEAKQEKPQIHKVPSKDPRISPVEVSSPPEINSPPEITRKIVLVEETEEEINDKEFETPSERMEVGKYTSQSINSISRTTNKKLTQSEARPLKTALQSFNPIMEAPQKEEEQAAIKNSQPYHLDVRASHGSPVMQEVLTLNTHKVNKQPAKRKVSVKQSDPSPIVFHNNPNTSFNSVSPDKKSKQVKVNKTLSEKGSPTVHVYPNSPPRETNEGKLIKKLGEKQKMLEKYESMLQKVNIEFQNTLNKNKELNNEISILEMRCQRAESQVHDAQGRYDGDKYTLQRQLDELVLEKDELQSDNVSLNKLLKNKNQEIEDLKNIKIELENRLINSSTSTSQSTKQETEMRILIDDLKKRILELEFEIKRKDSDYKTDISNCDLIAQGLRKDVEQLTLQRNDLSEQAIKLKEQLWKEILISRQLTNENENLKRENLNLRNTYDLTQDNESELRNENKYLREKTLDTERKTLLYQNIITQNDKLDISVIENLERALSLLRTSDELNRGLVTVNIEKVIDEVRTFRFRIKNKLENRYVKSV